MDADAKKHAVRFDEITKQINSVYETYAKSVGLSCTSLYILHLVLLKENCTQKYICEQMFLPKQTINSVVMSFHKQGLMEMFELPEDRRHKLIQLTSKGKEYAAKIIPKIEAAEIHSMEQFDIEERLQLLQLMEKYSRIFQAELR